MRLPDGRRLNCLYTAPLRNSGQMTIGKAHFSLGHHALSNLCKFMASTFWIRLAKFKILETWMYCWWNIVPPNRIVITDSHLQTYFLYFLLFDWKLFLWGFIFPRPNMLFTQINNNFIFEGIFCNEAFKFCWFREIFC